VAKLREALEVLPKEMDEAYDETMSRIEAQPEEDRKFAKHLIAWIVHAFRPLSLEAIQHALAVTPKTNSIDPDDLVDGDILLSLTAGLVVIDAEQSVLRLIRKCYVAKLKIII
jgi:ankyrin repeat domain-containing protein 50